MICRKPSPRLAPPVKRFAALLFFLPPSLSLSLPRAAPAGRVRSTQGRGRKQAVGQISLSRARQRDTACETDRSRAESARATRFLRKADPEPALIRSQSGLADQSLVNPARLSRCPLLSNPRRLGSRERRARESAEGDDGRARLTSRGLPSSPSEIPNSTLTRSVNAQPWPGGVLVARL